MSATHRIRRQRWQVTAASAADAFALRSALRRESEGSLVPALEKAFDALDDGQRDIHLPRLEVKVRVSSLAQLADELPKRLAEAARLALAEALQATPSPASAEAASQLTPAGRLRRYLNSGQVDWFDADRQHDQLLRLLADEARQWSAAPAAAWPALLVGLPDDGAKRSAAFFRFLQLLDEPARAVWRDFAEKLAAANGEPFASAQRLLRHWQLIHPADPALRLQALGLLLIVADPRHSPRRRGEWTTAVGVCASLLEPLSTVDREKWRKMATLFAEPAGASPPSPASANRPGEFKNSTSFPVDRDHAETSLESDAAPGLALRSAGLVLLYPYLPRLFAALGWVGTAPRQGEAFPRGKLPRAAALLNWLASGRDEPYEFELGTAKLLLGLNPDDALPVAAGLLGEAEREEGAALLGAVVEHWAALGQTSIDGLRLSFLQRGGLLYPAADGWLLRPQGESFDMLLDRLPWGIAIVRLPWMKRSLHTEWPRP